MFIAELRIPVNRRVVKFESAAALAHFNGQVIRTSKQLVLEGTELILCSNIVYLVDDRADSGILVQDDLSDDVFVGEVLVPQIEMSFMSLALTTDTET
jgi:hypothetical protein